MSLFFQCRLSAVSFTNVNIAMCFLYERCVCVLCTAVLLLVLVVVVAAVFSSFASVMVVMLLLLLSLSLFVDALVCTIVNGSLQSFNAV